MTDFMRISDDGQEVETLSNWSSTPEQPFPYMTAVWDKRARRPRWQPMIMATDGRAARITFGTGSLVDKDGQEHLFWEEVANDDQRAA